MPPLLRDYRLIIIALLNNSVKSEDGLMDLWKPAYRGYVLPIADHKSILSLGNPVCELPALMPENNADND